MENDTSILVRLPSELKAAIEAAAAHEHRSVNAQLRHWIERALAERRLVDAPATYAVPQAK
jgi:hypothetical protein